MGWRQKAPLIKALMGILHGSRAFGGPLRANISLTNRCNIRCIHCFYHSPHLEKVNMHQLRAKTGEVEKIEADQERTVALINELVEMGTTSFIFTGGGEPFMHKNILDFIGRAKLAGANCKVNTNGTLLDRPRLDELIKTGLDELKITTMAGKAAMYVRTHPGAKEQTFSKLRDNLCYLAERKAALAVKKPRVNLVYIAVAQNYDGIFDFVEFARQVRADKVSFRPVHDLDDPGLARVVPTAKQAAAVREQLGAARSRLEAPELSHNIDSFLRVFQQDLNTRDLYRLIPCYYGWLLARIEPDGPVYPCCRCYESMGNIYERSFREIWYGGSYRRFRQEALSINRRRSGVRDCDCDSCPHHTANLKVYKALHPATAWIRIKRLEQAFRKKAPVEAGV